MQNHSENTKRIAKNTLMLYGRMLFSMVVSLYTSRVILNALGVVDYGIADVVGGLVAMFSLISNSLSAAVSRFLTFELGRGDKERLNIVFSTSLLIHIALSVLVLLVAETVGLWFVNNKMTIPADRLYAANWVYQASIFSFVFGLFSVPYNASIVSHERMGVFAYMGIADSLLKLSAVLFVAHTSSRLDKLIIYSTLLTIVGFTMQSIYLWYCRKHFPECRLKVNLHKDFLREMSAFAGWNFIGCTASFLKDQGVNVLLNIFIGPVLNASRGVADSVNRAVCGFAGNFMTALNPQITKSYAADNLSYAHYLVECGSRFSFYILLLFAMPILLETEFILALWLKNYPEYAVVFVRLVLIQSLINILSNTLITLQNATGNMKNYQLVVGGILLLNFPISYLCLNYGLKPESTYIVAIVIAVLCLFARLLFLRKSARLPIRGFIQNVVLNVAEVTIVAAIAPIILYLFMPDGWVRFMIVGAISLLSTVISVMFLGCNRSERSYITRTALSLMKKFISVRKSI